MKLKSSSKVLKPIIQYDVDLVSAGDDGHVVRLQWSENVAKKEKKPNALKKISQLRQIFERLGTIFGLEIAPRNEEEIKEETGESQR